MEQESNIQHRMDFDELKRAIVELKSDVKEFYYRSDTKLNYIQEQVTKTNGRVTKIETQEEKKKDDLLKWFFRFGLLVVGALAMVVLNRTGVVNLKETAEINPTITTINNQ